MLVDHKRAIIVLSKMIETLEHKKKGISSASMKGMIDVEIASIKLAVKELKITKQYGGAEGMTECAMIGLKSPELPGLFDS